MVQQNLDVNSAKTALFIRKLLSSFENCSLHSKTALFIRKLLFSFENCSFHSKTALFIILTCASQMGVLDKEKTQPKLGLLY